MNRPQAILFDFINTLVSNLKFDPLAGNTRLLEYAVDRKGISPEEVTTEAKRLDSEVAVAGNSIIEFTHHQFNRLLFDRLGITFREPMEVLELEFWKECMLFAPEPGIADVLTALSAHDLRMGVVSNHSVSGTVLSWELQRHELLNYFEFVISSADYGIRKPHPVIFTSAATRLNMAPSEIWYVGDTLETDMVGAKQCHMSAIWYNRRQQEHADIPVDAEVRSWEEFLELAQTYL